MRNTIIFLCIFLTGITSLIAQSKPSKEKKPLTRNQVNETILVAWDAMECGNAHYNRLDFEKAELCYTKAVNSFRVLAEVNTKKHEHDFATALYKLGKVQSKSDKRDKAEESFLEYVKTVRNLSEKDFENHKSNYAYVLMVLGDYTRTEISKSKAYYLESLKLSRELAEIDPVENSYYVAETAFRLGCITYHNIDKQESEPLFEEAYSIYKWYYKENNRISYKKQADMLYYLGSIRFYERDYTPAIDFFLESLDKYTIPENVDPEMRSKDVGMTKSVLGLAYYHKGDFDQSVKHYNDALASYGQLATTNSSYKEKVADAHVNLAWAHLKNEEVDKAMHHFEEGLKGYEALEDKDPEIEIERIASYYANIVSYYINKKNFTKAEEVIHKSISILESKIEANPRASLLELSDFAYSIANWYYDYDEDKTETYHQIGEQYNTRLLELDK